MAKKKKSPKLQHKNATKWLNFYLAEKVRVEAHIKQLTEDALPAILSEIARLQPEVDRLRKFIVGQTAQDKVRTKLGKTRQEIRKLERKASKIERTETEDRQLAEFNKTKREGV